MVFSHLKMVAVLRNSLVIMGLLAVSAPALAVPISWGFTSASCVSSCSPVRTTSKTFSSSPSGGPNAVVTAWANVVNGSDLTLGDGSSGASKVGLYSGGLGVTHGDGEGTGSPNHGLDNVGRYELLMFDLGPVPVALTNVSLGYFSGDSDITVLAYTGLDTPSLAGLVYNGSSQNLTTNGWKHIGNYDVDMTDATAPYDQAVSTSVRSKFWIVAALNDVFPGCSTAAGSCDETSGGDYVKVVGLSGDRKLPAPEALLLLFAAVPALLFLRRRSPTAR